MESLEGVVRVDGDSALETVNLEGDYAGLAPGLHVGEMVLRLDAVLQLLPDNDPSLISTNPSALKSTSTQWML